MRPLAFKRPSTHLAFKTNAPNQCETHGGGIGYWGEGRGDSGQMWAFDPSFHPHPGVFDCQNMTSLDSVDT